jgi:hypothetical protein
MALPRIEDALTQIQEIRGQLARTELYRGTRAASLAATSALAALAALLQPVVVPSPVVAPGGYVAFWSATAALALGIVGFQVLHSYRRTLSAQDRATTREVLASVAPAIGAGALVTAALTMRGLAALLPGLWPVFIGISVFAARSHFPKGSGALALGYVASGVWILAFEEGEDAFRPWVMGITFGLGQLAAAAVFYWNLERDPRAEEAP